PFSTSRASLLPLHDALPMFGLWFAMVAAAPATPVAWKVTGLPDNVPAVAVSVFSPAVALSVQEVRAAIPSAPLLTGVVGVTVPLDRKSTRLNSSHQIISYAV